jgi:hypothetical protein
MDHLMDLERPGLPLHDRARKGGSSAHEMNHHRQGTMRISTRGEDTSLISVQGDQ